LNIEAKSMFSSVSVNPKDLIASEHPFAVAS